MRYFKKNCFSKTYILFFFFVLSLNTFNANAQSSSLNFQQLDIHGVLFNKKVNVLFKDSYGYLWIGSNSGLYKYDGHNLTAYQYDAFKLTSLPNNNINSIVEDNFKNLWIGSESYLIHYDRKENAFKGFLKNNYSTVKTTTNQDTVWATLHDIGLLKIKTNKDIQNTDLVQNIKVSDSLNLYGLKNIDISAFVKDGFDRYWVGTKKGVFILNKSNTFIPTGFKEKIVDMKLFNDNRMLAISETGLYILGFNKADNKLEILEYYDDLVETLPKACQLTTLAVDLESDNLWIGSSAGLINALRKDNSYSFNYYSKELNNANILSDQITSTQFDDYGNLWIGTHKGINKYSGRNSLFEYNQITNNGFLTISIKNENTNTTITGSLSGLYKFNHKDKTHLKLDNNLKNIQLVTNNYDKTELFIADYLTIYQTNNYKTNDQSIELIKLKKYKKLIKHITPINKNEIWVALWDGGIDIINSSKVISKFKKSIIELLKAHHTSTLLLTKNNKIWIGTRGEGLYHIDLTKETSEHYLPSEKSGLTSNAILSLKEDTNGNIWVGTRGGGINMYDKNTNSFKNFNATNAYSPKTISAIEEDYSGNLWMSTRDGLTLFNIKKQHFIPFGVEDGINENQFSFNSSSSNPDKTILYFGCSDGFYSVHTKKLIQQNIVPTTVITSFSTIGATYDNQSKSTINTKNEFNIYSDKQIILPFDKNNIAVNFSSLDLTAPNKNQYAYRLKGLNEYWIYSDAFNRNANYNDLSPGTYTFMVKSTNSDGVWNETPSEITFTIKSPFWKSNWATLIYILLFLSVTHLGSILIKRWYHLKKNLVKETVSREKDNELNRMKIIFFTDISHELRTPLSLILGSIEKIVKEKKTNLSLLTSQRIYNNTLRMHRLINQIMDIRKFDEGKLKLKISKNDIVQDITTIKNAFSDFAKIYNIDYNFNNSHKKIKGWYDVDLLEKILFNLLSNAFKYTQENGEINLTLDLIEPENLLIGSHNLSGKHIKCSVRDNGVGIPEKDLNFIFDRYYQATKSQRNQIPGTGIGMELVHKLIEHHYGTIIVESKENVFTEFTFYLPISKNRYNKKERTLTSIPLNRTFIKNSEYQVVKELPPQAEDKKVATKKHRKHKILIVEDNNDLRQMIKDELITDFQIVEAPNGQEGYKIAQKEKPDLIISDILMPIQDGLSMLKEIKDNPKFNNTPIFMLTAKNSNESKIECLSLGANDYIEKPFSLEFLKWKIKNTFETRTNLKEKYSKLITTAPSDIEIDSNDEKFIKKLIELIETNITNSELSVKFLATEAGMSRANLYRKTQQILNETPVNFIRTIKLKRAAQLLKQDKMYISEVAYMTGFNNQKYFRECFNKEYGISPTEYIKQNSKK